MSYNKSFSTDQETDDAFKERIAKDIGNYRAYSSTITRLTKLYAERGEEWLKQQEND